MDFTIYIYIERFFKYILNICSGCKKCKKNKKRFSKKINFGHFKNVHFSIIHKTFS